MTLPITSITLHQRITMDGRAVVTLETTRVLPPLRVWRSVQSAEAHARFDVHTACLALVAAQLRAVVTL